MAGAAPVGHKHDLESVPEFTVRSRAEQIFEAFGLGRRQLDADQSGPPTEGITDCWRMRHHQSVHVLDFRLE